MPRLTADKVAGSPRGQEYIWQVIMELDAKGSFTLADIVGRTNTTRYGVGDYLRRLCKGAFLRVVGETALRGVRRYEYRVAVKRRRAPRLRKDGSELPPTKRENMWRTMRMHRQFTARDVSVLSSTEDVPVRLVDTKDYIKMLFHAGYLRVTAKNGNANVYTLVKNTGPRPPQVQRVRQVFDPNINAVVWPLGGAND